MPAGPKITLARKSGAAALARRVLGIGSLAAYVGVPAAASGRRSKQLLEMAGRVCGEKKRARLEKAAKTDINNAELLYVFTEGSPARNQPPRPVLKPAVAADGNREPIARELQGMVKAQLGGDHDAAVKAASRAALAGQNAARRWFTDGRNAWAPNAPSTIKAKGSNRPGIDTGAMRASIQGIVGEE
jgi:hypothetical protein